MRDVSLTVTSSTNCNSAHLRNQYCLPENKKKTLLPTKKTAECAIEDGLRLLRKVSKTFRLSTYIKFLPRFRLYKTLPLKSFLLRGYFSVLNLFWLCHGKSIGMERNKNINKNDRK